MERRNQSIRNMLGGVVQRAPASPLYDRMPGEGAMDFFRRTGLMLPFAGGDNEDEHYDQLPEEVRGQLGDVAQLSDDDLDRVEGELAELARNEETPIEAVEQAVEAVTALQTERGRRTEAAEQEATRRTELLAQLDPEGSGEETPEGETPAGETPEGETPAGEQTPEGETPEGETPQAEETPEGETPAQPEAVAASSRRVPARRPSPGAMSRGRPANQAPRQGNDATQTRILDANGNELDGILAAAERFIRTSESLGRGADGDLVRVASLRAEVPQDRLIRDIGDANANGAILAAISEPDAIVAAGGLCAPTTVDYDIPNISDSSRPVRDDLPQAGTATRGGIRFARPANFSALDGAVRIWTMANDAAAVEDENVRKPCIRVDCEDFDEVFIRAIPVCLTFGNIGARAWPEQVANALRSAMAAQARIAEAELLFDIAAAGDTVTAGAEVSATRDILGAVGRAVARYRYYHRTAANFPLRANLPQWLRDLIRSDLALELPGSSQERLAVADATIESFFAARSVRTTWRMDEERGYTAGKPFYGAQADDSPLIEFPTAARIYLSHEGAFSFISMPELDLGLVRDSTLNARNDYQIFAETFEGVAHRGFQALNLDIDLCPSGATSGTVDYVCPSGS